MENGGNQLWEIIQLFPRQPHPKVHMGCPLPQTRAVYQDAKTAESRPIHCVPTLAVVSLVPQTIAGRSPEGMAASRNMTVRH